LVSAGQNRKKRSAENPPSKGNQNTVSLTQIIKTVIFIVIVNSTSSMTWNFF